MFGMAEPQVQDPLIGRMAYLLQTGAQDVFAQQQEKRGGGIHAAPKPPFHQMHAGALRMDGA